MKKNKNEKLNELEFITPDELAKFISEKKLAPVPKSAFNETNEIADDFIFRKKLRDSATDFIELFDLYYFKSFDKTKWIKEIDELSMIPKARMKWEKWKKQNTEVELNTQPKTKDYTKKIWFKVGLLFATGEMDKLITQFKSNATQIATHLGNKSFRPYISESISKTNDTDKNIFSSKKYCYKTYNN